MTDQSVPEIQVGEVLIGSEVTLRCGYGDPRGRRSMFGAPLPVPGGIVVKHNKVTTGVEIPWVGGVYNVPKTTMATVVSEPEISNDSTLFYQQGMLA